jgi:hypothetical protein
MYIQIPILFLAVGSVIDERGPGSHARTLMELELVESHGQGAISLGFPSNWVRVPATKALGPLRIIPLWVISASLFGKGRRSCM